MKPKAAFVSEDPGTLAQVYGPSVRARLEARAALVNGCLERRGLVQAGPGFSDLEVLFSTWGMPELSASELERLPGLKAVFYAAGSVRAFARPFLERGIAVFSAADANARPTAEFTLAQILLAGKRALPAGAALRRAGRAAWSVPEGCAGNYGCAVALLGAGRVGRLVIELLKPFDLDVLVFDPLLSETEIGSLGVTKVPLEEAFARGQVVSNHLADLAATRGLITGDLLRTMRPYATFINTGRGATVNEAQLWATLQDRKDLCAVLDVTDPEPPLADSPAYSLDNVFLYPHLAGSRGNEFGRMALLMAEEFEAWLDDKPTRHRVDFKTLENSA